MLSIGNRLCIGAYLLASDLTNVILKCGSIFLLLWDRRVLSHDVCTHILASDLLNVLNVGLLLLGRVLSQNIYYMQAYNG